MCKTFDSVLGLFDFEALNSEISPEILQKLDLRNQAKKEKNFEKADALRDELLSL